MVADLEREGEPYYQGPYLQGWARSIMKKVQNGLDNRALKCNIFKAFFVQAVAETTKESLSCGEEARGFVNRTGR